MKISIIIPVLNSHEILRRQMLHFSKIGLPKDVEIIVVDDGSEPPLEYSGSLPVRIHRTNDKRPWTWALARNAGARIAHGEYLLMFDIDHIITRELIDYIYNTTYDKVRFKREFGVILEDGTITQDLNILTHYGFPMQRYKTRGLTISPLPNNFAMKKKVFNNIGGYREDLIGRPYPQGEDRSFKKAWCEYERTGGTISPFSPLTYMFPNGYKCGDVDFNPFGLFHKLSRANRYNYRYREQLRCQ